LNGVLSSKFIDLDSMYENLQLTDEYEYVKYSGKKKTHETESTCSTFLNQMTVRMKNGVDIKFFNNSTFSISGAGNVDNAISLATETVNKILKSLLKISIEEVVIPKVIQGFHCMYDTRIITRNGNSFEISSNVVDKKTIINGKHCIPFDLLIGTYIEVKHVDKKKIIYNNVCENVGYVQYLMKRKNKSLCIKNCVYNKISENSYSIVNPYSNEIGILEVHLELDSTPIVLPEKLPIKITVCDPDTCITSIQFSNCNYNLKYGDSVTFLDRDKICKELEKMSISYTYNPSSYPGVKFTIDNAKITIFRTGAILFSSKTSIHKEALPFVYKLFEKDLTVEKYTVIQENIEELSIWDI
jgi:hypothetical protein